MNKLSHQSIFSCFGTYGCSEHLFPRFVIVSLLSSGTVTAKGREYVMKLFRNVIGLLLIASLAGLLLVTANSANARRAKGEWPVYGADNRATKYSPLNQINADNVSKLRVAWKWESPDGEILKRQPELRAEAIEILKKYEYGPLFTPPGKRPTIILPGVVGGANWTGAAADPETGMLYVPSTTLPLALGLEQSAVGKSDFSAEIAGGGRVAGPRGLPLFKPPYGRITAIDLNQGTIHWVTPLGDGPRNHPALKDLKLGPLGSAGRNAPLLTKTLLFAGEGPQVPTGAPMLRAFDKATGKVIWEFKLDAHVLGAPMTYLAGGRQYLVVASGYQKWPHQLTAFSLP